MCRPRGTLRRRIPAHAPQPVVPPSPIPIKSVCVSAKILDFVSEVKLSQKFQNVEPNPIEAVYEFPLNDKSSICGFTAKIDGKVIQGTVQEKEEAKDSYDDGIAMGHGAYLLEESEEDPNVFSVSVGNLPPQKEVTIEITYVQELTFDDEGELKWTLPSRTEVDPYNPYQDTKKFQIPQLDFRLDLQMTSFIKKVSSSSHPISFEFGDEPNEATIELASEPDDVMKDLEVRVRLAKPHTPCSRVQKDGKGNLAAMVSLYPKLDLEEDEEIYTEMVFIVDRSGSMAGSRITQVKDTLHIFLRSLSEGTMFNIIGFGSRTDMLFKGGSVEYNEKNLETAVAHVKKMRANLGGTNILKPLQQVLQSSRIEGYPRQLFVLTDGEVSNTTDCVDFVRRHADTTRVFTFGVGADASVGLVKGMAQAGEGFYEFVNKGESMEGKVLRQLNRAMQPALTDIKLDWNRADVAQAPYRLPPLFCGGRLVVYGLLPKSGCPGKLTVTLTAQTAIKPFCTSMELDLEAAAESDLIHRLCARLMLRSLKDGRSYMHDKEGNFVSPHTQASADEETIRLSTSYSIISHLTAFVAVEERDEITEGTMETRKVPVTLEKVSSAPPPPVGGSLLVGPKTGYVAKPPSVSTGVVIGTPTSFAHNSHIGWDDSMAELRPVLARGAAPIWASTESDLDVGGSGGGGFGGLFKRKSPRKSHKKKDGVKEKQGNREEDAKSMRPVEAKKSGAPGRRGRGRGAAVSGRGGLSSLSDNAPPPPRAAQAPASPAYGPPSGAPFVPSDRLSYASIDYGECAIDSSEDESDDSCSDDAGLSVRKEQEAKRLEAIAKKIAAEEEKKKKEEAVDVADDLRKVILKQKANGSWTLEDVVVLGLDATKVKSACPEEADGVLDVWATAVIVAYLEASFSSQKTNWALVVRKAKRFISKQRKALSLTVDVNAVAKTFVSERSS